MKIRIKKHLGTIVLSLIIIMTIFLCVSIHASGKNQSLNRKLDQAGHETRDMEKAYRQDLKVFLCDAGFSNSGINMTKTVNYFELPDGSTDGTVILNYTVSIHHQKISDLSIDELSSLLTEIVSIDLPVEGSTISYKFGCIF